LRSRAVKSTPNIAALIGRLLAGTAAAAFAVAAYSYLTLPDVRPLATTNPSTTAFIELRADQARSQGRNPRQLQRWIAYRRISPNLKRAVLVAEDSAFWQHDGVDYDELQKSLEVDWARGQLLRGASTITQQLAKNLFLSPSKNPARKIRELIITRRLEAELPKARILELYLNVIEWGDGIYGVEAASRNYFQQSASTLAPVPAALLAGAIVNPRLLNPGHPTPRLLRRQQMILKRMGAVTPPVEVVRAKSPGSLSAPAIEPSSALPLDAVPGILPTMPADEESTASEPK
jgi:monofunctional biosynthetic peptidoglycan transglycosylase